ncbi:MAG: hypothetical protein ACMXYE_03035 [Candidatus Woesearchaeota archaeon]
MEDTKRMENDKIHAEIAHEVISSSEKPDKESLVSNDFKFLMSVVMVTLMVLWVLAYIRW